MSKEEYGMKEHGKDALFACAAHELLSEESIRKTTQRQTAKKRYWKHVVF